MLEYRLFYLAGFLIIVLGFLVSIVLKNYGEYEEKLKIDFQEEGKAEVNHPWLKAVGLSLHQSD